MNKIQRQDSLTGFSLLKGFTLLEMMVVVIVIAILASLAIPQYQVATERARSAEAVTMLSAIRQSELRYYAEWNSYTADLSDLDYTVQSARYFYIDEVEVDPTVDFLVKVLRDDTIEYGFTSGYMLQIDAQGNISCIGYPALCGKMGY